MKLLVTGGSGFLGRRVCAYFETLGWQVFAPGHGQLDITDETGIRKWFDTHSPDAVIHTAAISDTGLCQREPEWSECINVDGSANLARVCRDWGVKPVICSSDQVYFGSTAPGPHTEVEILFPVNVYGRQKRRAEEKCLEILPETVCLRLSWMYARDHFSGEHGHFLSTLKAAMEDEDKTVILPVFDRRGMTDAADVVKNLSAALKLEGGVWNFGSGNDADTYTTVKNVLEQTGMDAMLRRLKPDEQAFAANPRDLTMDLRKLNSAGIRFPTTEEALARALKMQKDA